MGRLKAGEWETSPAELKENIFVVFETGGCKGHLGCSTVLAGDDIYGR